MAKPSPRRGGTQAALPLDDMPRIEPKLLDQAEPPPAQPVQSAQPDQIDALVVDIFQLSGLKISRDEPLIAAALLQSRLVESAASTAARILAQHADEAAAKLQQAVAASRSQVEQIDRAMAHACAQLTEGARAAGEQELLALRTSFTRSAVETLGQVRRSAQGRAGWRHWWRDPAGLLVGAVLGLATGCLCTAFWMRGPSAEQLRLIHNGTLLDAAWHRLPPAQRQLINDGGWPTPSVPRPADGDTKVPAAREAPSRRH